MGGASSPTLAMMNGMLSGFIENNIRNVPEDKLYEMLTHLSREFLIWRDGPEDAESE